MDNTRKAQTGIDFKCAELFQRLFDDGYMEQAYAIAEKYTDPWRRKVEYVEFMRLQGYPEDTIQWYE